MKFDFDTFEFAGLIAPGSVIVLAIALLQPHLLQAGDSAVLIAIAIIAAYVIGHLVAAIANAAEPLFRLLRVRDLGSLSNEEWTSRGCIADDQWTRFEQLVDAKLHRQWPLGGPGSTQRKTVVKQMYLAILGNDRPERVTTFDGLYNLSRGLFVAFIICVLLALVARQYTTAWLCTTAAGLSLYRMRKFKKTYSRELIQQFLLLDDSIAAPSPSAPQARRDSI
jgi:hypothetical protein